jgi:hypothetical protein
MTLVTKVFSQLRLKQAAWIATRRSTLNRVQPSHRPSDRSQVGQLVGDSISSTGRNARRSYADEVHADFARVNRRESAMKVRAWMKINSLMI